jgi:hypothetical protein
MFFSSRGAMERDQFFDNIMRQVDEIDTAKAGMMEAVKTNSGFVAELVLRITPLLETYRQAMEGRGILATLKINTRSFKFMMYYNNGNHSGFGIEQDSRSGSFRLVSYFSGPDGRDMKGISKDVISRSSWSDDDFETFMQGCISDFLARAMQHGGYIQVK